MKRILITLITSFVMINLSAQGWVSGASNSLYSVNSSLGLSPLSVGIGVAAPTAQFHTTGTVRFAGLLQNDLLTRVLVTDSNGNLAWRNASTLGAGADWSLTGNAGTNPASNFLGTTDNQRLVFRTNNTEKMTILGSGSVGIGYNNPQKLVHIYSTVGDNQLGISGNTPSTIWFAGTTQNAYINAGRIGLATGATDFVSTSVPGDFVIQNIDTARSLIFGTSRGVNGLERMRIDSRGFVGISTTTPTAKLHVNCSPIAGQVTSNIRFQNLPTGSGEMLVIDANGYVYKSNLARPGATGSNAEMDKKIQSLENEIRELRQLILSNNASASSKLFTVYPNPSTHEVLVKQSQPKTITGSVIITDLNGKQVSSRFTLRDSVTIPLNNLVSGSYVVSLYDEDNKLVEAQKIIVNR